MDYEEAYKLFVKHKNITVEDKDASDFLQFISEKLKRFYKLKLEINRADEKTKITLL